MTEEGTSNGQCNTAECDTQRDYEHPARSIISTDSACQLERTYVNDVYESIAEHFDQTRHSQWTSVVDFMSQMPLCSLIIDIGAGNGKYVRPDSRHIKIGCDISEKLCSIATAKGAQMVNADARYLPFLPNTFDYALSIAVIHHFASESRRVDAIREMINVLRPRGRAMISVWAFEQRFDAKPSEYIKWGGDGAKKCSQQQLPSEHPSCLPIHSRNSEFRQQDLLVPWRNSGHESLRFYHVFKEGELVQLIVNSQLPVVIIDCFYEQGNWFVIIEKNMDSSG